MRERDRVDAAFREGKLIGAEGVSHRIDAYRRYVVFLRDRLAKAQVLANRNHAWYMEMVGKQGATLNDLTQARQRIAALEQVVAEGNAACWDAWQERDGLKTQVAVLRSQFPRPASELEIERNTLREQLNLEREAREHDVMEMKAQVGVLRDATLQAAVWLESRPDMDEGDAATSSVLRAALAAVPQGQPTPDQTVDILLEITAAMNKPTPDRWDAVVEAAREWVADQREYYGQHFGGWPCDTALFAAVDALDGERGGSR